jgi:hypothetical protein
MKNSCSDEKKAQQSEAEFKSEIAVAAMDNLSYLLWINYTRKDFWMQVYV